MLDRADPVRMEKHSLLVIQGHGQFPYKKTTLSLKDVLMTTCALLDKGQDHTGGVIAVLSRSWLLQHHAWAESVPWPREACGTAWYGTAQPKTMLAVQCLPGFAAVCSGLVVRTNTAHPLIHM